MLSLDQLVYEFRKIQVQIKEANNDGRNQFLCDDIRNHKSGKMQVGFLEKRIGQLLNRIGQ